LKSDYQVLCRSSGICRRASFRCWST